MNASVKLIFILALIICINLVPPRSWVSYTFFLVLLVGGFFCARIQFKTVILRSLVSTPFILAAFPLIFSGIEPFFSILILNRFEITISQTGLTSFAAIAIKSWLSLLAAIFLTSTTHYDDILTALRSLGLPKVFVSILTLMWRYLSLIIEEARSLTRAKDSRSAASAHRNRPAGSIAWRAQITGRMAGNLLLRSIDRSERVYAAMAARGYSGEPPRSIVKKMRPQDYLHLSVAILLCLCGIVLASLIP